MSSEALPLLFDFLMQPILIVVAVAAFKWIVNCLTFPFTRNPNIKMCSLAFQKIFSYQATPGFRFTQVSLLLKICYTFQHHLQSSKQESVNQTIQTIFSLTLFGDSQTHKSFNNSLYYTFWVALYVIKFTT